jgi:hypothetical protein
VRKRVRIACAIGLLIAASPLDAQAVRPGQRVRLHTVDGESARGTLMEITPGEYRLRDDATEMSLDRGLVIGIDRSLGEQRQFWKHLGITVAVGSLGLGTYAAIADDGSCTDGPFGCMSAGGSLVLGAIVGGIYSLPIGLVLGLVIHSERWEPVPLPASASLLVKPMGAGRVAYGVSIPVRHGDR